MVRTNYHMTEQQVAALRRLARTTGLPAAELVRRAVEAFLKREAKRAAKKVPK